MAVIDASVWVALFHDKDHHHKKAYQIVDKLIDTGESFHVPVLAFTEVGGTIKRLTGQTPTANSVVAKMREMVSNVHEIDQNLEKVATQIAITAGLRGADAVYVALAMEESEPLITFDEQQRAKASQFVDVEST